MTESFSQLREGGRVRPTRAMTTVSPEFRRALVDAIPALRAFAILLIGSSDRADDLVQKILVKAWAHYASFTTGTGLRSWLYRILRNEFYTYTRWNSREVEDIDDNLTGSVRANPAPRRHFDIADLRAALLQLPTRQCEVLLLVAASGFSYKEVAAICHVPIGTIKSRVNRARIRLAEKLGLGKDYCFSTSPTVLAAT